MRPEHEQAHPIRTGDATEFDSVFTQLGPNDVSYKVRTQKKVHQYLLGEAVGEGSYAKVKEAIDTSTNRKVAIKILTKRKLRKLPHGESAVKKEVEVLSKLRHVNIVEHIDYFTVEDKGKIYIVLEYVNGGTLQGLIERAHDGIMPRRQAQLIFRQLLNAVEYMHSRNVVHCDIKPDNMMFTTDGVLKLTDFGVAEEIGLESDYEILTKSGGSPAFQPPEVKSGGKASSPVKIDIWALGITLYIIATGKYPFSGTNIYTICENISKGEYQLPETLEPELAKLIKGILQINPMDRYTISDMRKNPWVANDITSDEPLLPYASASSDRPQHDIFAQNHRASTGVQNLYSSEDCEDEPTMFQMELSEHSNYSGGAQNTVPYPDSPSLESSMTNLHDPTNTTTPPFASPKKRKKQRCLIM